MQIQFFFYLILIYFLVIENQVIPKPIKFGLICVHISLLLLIYIVLVWFPYFIIYVILRYFIILFIYLNDRIVGTDFLNNMFGKNISINKSHPYKISICASFVFLKSLQNVTAFSPLFPRNKKQMIITPTFS